MAGEFEKAGPTPCLGNTIELALERATGEVPQAHKHRRADSVTLLPCGAMGEGEMLCSPPPCPFVPVVSRRAGPKVMRAGELALPFSTYDTQESGLCTLPEQYSRADAVKGALVSWHREYYVERAGPAL